MLLREWSRWGEEIGKAERLPKNVGAMKIGAVLRSTAFSKKQVGIGPEERIALRKSKVSSRWEVIFRSWNVGVRGGG